MNIYFRKFARGGSGRASDRYRFPVASYNPNQFRMFYQF